MSPKKLEEAILELSVGIPGLAAELRDKLVHPRGPQTIAASPTALRAARIVNVDPDDEEGVALERVIVKMAGARPVAKICGNVATTDFIGPASPLWAAAIEAAKPSIDRHVPAVGLLEIADGDHPVAGTGWLIASGIVVTNRHVATAFARRDPATSRGTFKPGLVGDSIGVRIDFLGEECSQARAEFPITEVLWIAPPDEADVAFLRATALPGQPLPAAVPLAKTDPGPDTVIAAIGYPSRDTDMRDQALVISIFGKDVYDKKRLAPGRVLGVEGTTLKHDCSTLGGNSGSLLVDMKTGLAVGLHRAGLLDDSANLAVPARHLHTLLQPFVANDSAESPVTATPETPPPPRPAPAPTPGWEMRFPFEIVISIKPLGAPAVLASASTPGQATFEPAPPPPAAHIQEAVERAIQAFGQVADVLDVRAGYRFRQGWITDERVVVIEVREKLGIGELQDAEAVPFPATIGGFAIDVRTASLSNQLRFLGVELAEELERPAKPGMYKEPRGYDMPGSSVHLESVRDTMTAIFHVSPEAGFRNLGPFIERTQDRLAATMYEWELKAGHIGDAIEAAIKPVATRKLKMVTQRRGVAESEATERAVLDMQKRLNGQFEHVWASVRGSGRLFPSSYHIKVAVRDGEEFWLSSGNWKNSGQALKPDDEVGEGSNREWHVIVKNERLAKLFEAYIEHDFRQAQRAAQEVEESAPSPDLAVEFFIPATAFEFASRKIRRRRYQTELVIDNEELDIQPLLTPDRDAELRPLFLRVATDMVRRAKRSVYLQNQSFKLTEKNNSEFDEFFEVLRDKQKEIGNVCIIMRDAREYGREKDTLAQQQLIERLKVFGISTSPDRLRLQWGCHTKGIVIDSKEVLLGSHNLTNEGALYNRDASLLIRSPKVAKFFERIFLFDWDNLTHNNIDELIGGMRRALPGEPTPDGFRRISLAELLGES